MKSDFELIRDRETERAKKEQKILVVDFQKRQLIEAIDVASLHQSAQKPDDKEDDVFMMFDL